VAADVHAAEEDDERHWRKLRHSNARRQIAPTS